MKKIILGTLLCFSVLYSVQAQVGIGTKNPVTGSILDLTSDNKALVVTRVAGVESIESPVNGMVIYDISLQCFRYFQKGVWSECNAQVTPEVNSIDCANVLLQGTLINGKPASSVSLALHYVGGNGGTYQGSILSSSGVTGLTAILSAGTLATGDGAVTYAIIGTPSSAGTATFAATIGGVTCDFSVQVQDSSGSEVATLGCESATVFGTLTANTVASGVFVSIDYTGGNGAVFNPQIIQSTGVTGLTAFLNSGTLISGSGKIVLEITGNPAASGVANFAFTFGTVACSFSLNVDAPPVIISFTNCSANSSGTLTQGQTATGTQTVNYSGGNGASYSATSFASAGVSGLTANLAAGSLANGNGSFNFTISGNPNSSGTATFNINLFGASCSFTRAVSPPAATATFDCTNAVFSPSAITKGVSYSGTISVPYSAGNSQSYGSGTGISSTGVTGLTATLQAGTLGTSGNLIYNVTGTPASSGTASFALIFGSSNCAVTKTVDGPLVSGITCASGTFNPVTITANTAYSGTLTVPYTGGNGATYPAGTAIASTGVTGLTATLQAGTLAIGNGNFTYTISGTATSAGNAVFALAFGTTSCNLTKAVSSFPTSFTATTTLLAQTHLTSASFPVFYDNIVTYTAQDVTFGNMDDLRLHQPAGDIVQTVLNTPIPVGGKIKISYSDIKKTNGLGLIVKFKNGATASQTTINSLTNSMTNATQSASGNDLTITINVVALTNTIVVQSSNNAGGEHPILLEIAVYDSNNVRIPITQ